MKNTFRYWKHVCVLAWAETKSEIRQSLIKFIVGAIIVVGLIHFGVTAVGFDKLVTVGAVLGIALLGFLWKLLAIPARLHNWQVDAEDRKVIARKLGALFEDGRRLLGSSPKSSMGWANQVQLWEEQVEAVLRAYSEEERLMFATITLYTPDTPSAWVERLEAKLTKLRNITGRAHREPGGDELHGSV